MSDLAPHDKAMIEAFTTCANAIADVPEHLQQRVIRALQALFPDKPKAPTEPYGGPSSAERSFLQGLIPIGPTKYGSGL